MVELRQTLHKLWIPKSLIDLILDYQQLTLSPELDPQLLKKALVQADQQTINTDFRKACYGGQLKYVRELWPQVDIASGSQSASKILDFTIRFNRRKTAQYLIQELYFHLSMTTAWLTKVMHGNNLKNHQISPGRRLCRLR